MEMTGQALPRLHMHHLLPHASYSHAHQSVAKHFRFQLWSQQNKINIFKSNSYATLSRRLSWIEASQREIVIIDKPVSEIVEHVGYVSVCCVMCHVQSEWNSIYYVDHNVEWLQLERVRPTNCNSHRAVEKWKTFSHRVEMNSSEPFANHIIRSTGHFYQLYYSE